MLVILIWMLDSWTG